MQIPVQLRRRWMIGVFAVVALVTPAMAAPQNSPASRDNSTAKATSATPLEQTAAIAKSSDANLPVRRVVLYKSGVGFFEHQGQIQGNQTVGIDFTSGQLNDVLQSLTLLDLNGGRITGVNYNSQAPLNQRLGALDLPLEEKTDVAQFYGALRGVRLEIKSGSGVITGRLLSVERKTRVSGGTTLEVDLATVVSDAGEVRTVEITPAVTVRVAERGVTQKVSQYLSLLASVRQQELRRLTVATAGTGDRQLYVSYISEVPIWKTTYRIVLPSKAGDEPLLQGWAIVDNTIGEDWNNVELSLVAGAPQSFIQQLSQPYYVRRPVVALPGSAQVSPQTHEGAMLGGSAGLSGAVLDQSGGIIAGAHVTLTSASGESAGSTTTDNLGRYSFGDLPAANYALRVESRGFQTTLVQGLSMGGGRAVTQNVTLRPGAQTQTITVTAEAPSINTSNAEVGAVRGANVGSGAELGGAGLLGGLGGGLLMQPARAVPPPPPPPLANSSEISQAREQMASVAEGTDLGDLFQYKLKDHVTIHKNESALVPILQAHVRAEKVSLWNASEGSPRPLRALWITNADALTLDGGSFSVLEDETFAGEGLTDSIKPGEKRLVSYAIDLGVRVDKKVEGTPQRVTHVRIVRGEMVQTSEMRQKTVYTIRNDDTTSREVLIEHPLRAGWLIAESGPQPAETTSNLDRFRVSVNAKATETLELNESQPIEARFALTNLTSDQITVFLQQKSITPAVEAAFRKIVEQKSQVDALDAEVSRRDEKGKIFDDQQRLRENLKALKGSQEERALTQRYTQQLADQETRLETLNRESADLQAKSDQAQKGLDDLIQNLDLDASFH
jgi:hypothetical protein